LKCEIRKEVLCEIKRFKPYDFFQTLLHKASRAHQQAGAVPIPVLHDWLSRNDVVTSQAELGDLIRSYSYSSKYGESQKEPYLLYKDFLEYIVVPARKEKLREKVLRKSGLKGPVKEKKKPKKSEDGQSVSGVSGVSGQTKETSNSVERRKEEEKARISTEFATAQVFEQELRLHRQIMIVKQKIMKTNFEQIIYRETQPTVDIVEDSDLLPVHAFPPSIKDLNFIEVFNMLDKACKGHVTKNDLLKFLNKFVLNARFTVEDICQIYKRLKIDAGDDSDTLTYINFMTAILPPPVETGACLSGQVSPQGGSPNRRYSPARIRTAQVGSPMKSGNAVNVTLKVNVNSRAEASQRGSDRRSMPPGSVRGSSNDRG